MIKKQAGFLSELAGRIGPAIFSATMVVCLLSERFEPMHLILLGTGIALIGISYLTAGRNRVE